MSDAWALFDDEDDAPAAAAKRPRSEGTEGEGGHAAGREGGSGWEARSAGREPETAATHAYFAASRDMWPAGAVILDPRGPRPTEPGPSSTGRAKTVTTLAEFLDDIVSDARGRVKGIAARLGRFRPEGRAASAALTAAEASASAGDWPRVAAETTECLAAHSRQLDAGNWPDECWQASHTLALGLHIAAQLLAMNDGVYRPTAAATREDAGGSERSTVASSASASTSVEWQEASHAVLKGDPAAAAEEWDPATRLGRIALEALCMATLAVDKDALPPWLGAAVLLAERACVSALANRRGASSAASTGAAAQADERTAAAYMVPDALPSGAPAISPSRAVARVPAAGLTVAAFYSTYIATDTPVIITGAMTPSAGWAPIDEWRDLNRLLNTHGAGDRLVPVEYGGFGDRRGTGVLALGDLVREYLVGSNVSAPGENIRVAYMSQHALFHQVQALQGRIAVPSYTMGRLRADTGAVNAWIGTKDTTTALHRDPYLNLLAQAAGFKYVRLYAADQTDCLYAEAAVRGGNDNTFTRSSVCVEAPDYGAHPRFKDAVYLEEILGPGDMLFMPKGMWHYVRSVTTSVSINFWWT